MNIIFYKLQDEINDVKKTRTLTATQTYIPLTVTGTLKSATSKVTPSIEFSKPVDYFNDYNYCYIADFKRYYFVVDMVSSRNDYTIIDLRVDVLTSFLTQSNMGNLEGFVGRCANSSLYKVNVPDNKVQFNIEPVVVNYSVIPDRPSTNDINVTFSQNPDYNYVAVLASEYTEGISNSRMDVPVNLTNMVGGSYIYGKRIRTDYMKNGYVFNIKDTQGEVDVANLLSELMWTSSYATAVYSFFTYPFTIPHSTNKKKVRCNEDIIKTRDVSTGTENVDMETYYLENSTSNLLVLEDFVLTSPSGYTDFLKCEMYIPYLGYINISLKENIGCRLKVIYVIDYLTGNAYVYVYNQTKAQVIYQNSCQIGVQVPFSTSNMQENELKSQNYGLSYVVGMITSTAIGVVGAVTTNPYLIGAGMTGITTTTTNFINNENLLLDKTNTSVVNTAGLSGVFNKQNVQLRFTYLSPVNYDSSTKPNYIKHFGLPTNSLQVLSSIPVSGDYHTYAEITDLHTTSENGLYSMADITYREVEELKNLCASGIYL